jgi:uncharacterized protein (TIGR00299 family) protein
MNIAYFDCFSGIAGDMIIGALIDLGVEIEFLKNELKKINLSGYKINVNKVEKNHITGIDVYIKVEKPQQYRSYSDIKKLIKNSSLDNEIKKNSIKIFQKIAQAEGKIHSIPTDKVHFHEIGAIDSIIDIVGAIICITKLELKEIYCSPLPLGKGFVKCAHGLIPIPAPATVEILKKTPIYQTNRKQELVTPTGAAIITTIAKKFGENPSMKINKIGYGAGKTKSIYPNLLRILLGEIENIKKEKK